MSRSKKSFKLVVIDRDGTINTLREGFTRVPEEFVAVPGALEAVALLNRAGWHVVIATNQGEPVVGEESPAGKGYENICRRLTGEEIPVTDFSRHSGIRKKLSGLFHRR